VGYVYVEVDKLLVKGRVNFDKVNWFRLLVIGLMFKDGFVDVDFVIEVVFEEMLVK